MAGETHLRLSGFSDYGLHLLFRRKSWRYCRRGVAGEELRKINWRRESNWDPTFSAVIHRRPSQSSELKRRVEAEPQSVNGSGRDRRLLLRVPLVRRIERCILLAAQRFPRELDQVIGDESHAHRGMDLAVSQGMARRAPEMPAIVRLGLGSQVVRRCSNGLRRRGSLRLPGNESAKSSLILIRRPPFKDFGTIELS
jgi:hypothetical protein